MTKGYVNFLKQKKVLKEFNPQSIFSEHQHGRRFIVLYTDLAAVTSCEKVP